MEPTHLALSTEKLLNAQIAQEHAASFTYLEMATWTAVAGYKGAYLLLYKQSAEESIHMHRIIYYLTACERRPMMHSLPVALRIAAWILWLSG